MKRKLLSYDPIFKMKSGSLEEMTSLETKFARIIKIVTNLIFVSYGFFLFSILLISDEVYINFDFFGLFFSNDIVSIIYIVERILSVIVVTIFIVYILRRGEKYEIMQVETINLIRSASFTFIMITIVIVDFSVILHDPSNAWVMTFWKDEIVIFRVAALLDISFVLPATVLSIAGLVVQFLKMGKQTKSELLYYKSGDATDHFIVDKTIKRLKCVNTKKGRMCKITSIIDGKEFS